MGKVIYPCKVNQYASDVITHASCAYYIEDEREKEAHISSAIGAVMSLAEQFGYRVIKRPAPEAAE